MALETLAGHWGAEVNGQTVLTFQNLEGLGEC